MGSKQLQKYHRGRSQQIVKPFCYALLFGSFTLLPAGAAHATTGVNQQLNYQARLLSSSGATVADGTYNLEFKIYQDGTGCVASGTPPCGGTLKWTETRTGANKVTLKNGYFSVQLGEVSTFGSNVDWNQDTLWLSINVGGTSGSPTWDGEMTPFRRLAATSYALNSNQLGGRTAAQFVQSTTTTQTANIALQSGADADVTLFLKNRAAQSADIIRVVNNSDVLLFNLDTFGNFIASGSAAFAGVAAIGTSTSTGERLRIATISDGTIGLSVLGNIGQTADLINVDASGTRALNYTAAGTLVVTGGSGQTASLLTLQNSSNVPLFSADVANSRIQVGNATGDTTGALLVLDTKTDNGDPTGTNGGMYYNSNAGKFRCFQASAWADCIGAGGGGGRLDQVSAATADSTIASGASNIAWNWQLIAAEVGMSFGETAASIGGGANNQFVLQAATASGSTAAPLRVTSNSVDAADIVFNLASAGDLVIQDNGTDVWTFNDSGTTLFKPSADNAAAFEVQKAGSATQLFIIDSTNDRLYVGDDSSDATGTVLVLDNKNTSGDPTGVEGAMYYNSSSKSFRCFMNTRWRSCVAGVVFANTSVPAAIANTTTETNFAQNYSIPANDCQPGRVYQVIAQGVYGTTSIAPTLNLRVKLGTTNLAATGANATTASLTNREWRIEFQFICITSGATGTIESGGTFTRFTSAIASVLWELNNTTTATVNTTTAQTLQISAQWGTANAANTITMRQLIVEASGP